MVWGIRTRDLVHSRQARNAFIIVIALLLAIPLSVSLLGVGEITDSPDPVPAVYLTFNYNEGSHTLTVIHESGQTLEDDSIQFQTVDGRELATWHGPIEAGGRIHLEAVPADATVLVVWDAPNRDDDIVLARWSGPRVTP